MSRYRSGDWGNMRVCHFRLSLGLDWHGSEQLVVARVNADMLALGIFLIISLVLLLIRELGELCLRLSDEHIMSFAHVRSLVSGNKARYIDESTNINLDLVYGEPRRVQVGLTLQ